MKEDIFLDLYENINDLKQEITYINTNSNNISIDLNHCTHATYNLDERISNLEQKVDEIYSILFNAKKLNLSDLDN